LARFLVDPHAQPVSFEDPDEPGELQASWTRNGNRSIVTAAPVRDGSWPNVDPDGDWRQRSNEIELRPPDIARLARFLAT
jgi:hypothetical protein